MDLTGVKKLLLGISVLGNHYWGKRDTAKAQLIQKVT